MVTDSNKLINIMNKKEPSSIGPFKFSMINMRAFYLTSNMNYSTIMPLYRHLEPSHISMATRKLEKIIFSIGSIWPRKS